MIFWAVLSDEQMRNEWPFSLLNDEQMSNKVGVEHQPVFHFIGDTWDRLNFHQESTFQQTAADGPLQRRVTPQDFIPSNGWHLKIGRNPKGNDRLPTIYFQGLC